MISNDSKLLNFKSIEYPQASQFQNLFGTQDFLMDRIFYRKYIPSI